MRKIATFAVLVTLAAGPLWADDKKPDPKAAEEAMMKAGTPGENHKRLDFLAGSWDTTVKFWMEPGKPPMESKATCQMKWILDGRFVEQKFEGDFGGMKFHGLGLVGYDNLQKKYTAAWVDNMTTSILTMAGKYDADKKTFTFHGEEIDPVNGQKMKTKSVQRIVDENKYNEEFFREVDGKDVKVMEITYTRSKK